MHEADLLTYPSSLPGMPGGEAGLSLSGKSHKKPGSSHCRACSEVRSLCHSVCSLPGIAWMRTPRAFPRMNEISTFSQGKKNKYMSWFRTQRKSVGPQVALLYNSGFSGVNFLGRGVSPLHLMLLDVLKSRQMVVISMG